MMVTFILKSHKDNNLYDKSSKQIHLIDHNKIIEDNEEGDEDEDVITDEQLYDIVETTINAVYDDNSI